MRILLNFLGVIIILFTFKAISFGQSIDTSWTKIYWQDYYDSANCVQETSDGGFIITGSSILSGTYLAAQYVSSDGWILADSVVAYVAEDSVGLLPGFTAFEGSDFVAVTGACPPQAMPAEARASGY